MAKGWESKSVEEQMQDARVSDHGGPRKQLTAEQMEAHRQKEVLRLSRARVEKELAASQNPRYREQLTKALADLDEQLSRMGEQD